MSTKAQGKGARYNWTNTGSAVAADAVVILNSGLTGKIGIAIDAIGAGATGVLAIGGPDERIQGPFTKKSGDVFTDMQIVYWDSGNSRLTSSSTGNTRAGRSYGVYASAATTCSILINE